MATGVKISSCILAVLLDGQRRGTPDLLPYLRCRIDPSMAVRYYWTRHRSGSGNPPPIEKQVEEGMRVLLSSSLRQLEAAGMVVVEKPPERYEGVLAFDTWNVQLSEEGSRILWTPSGQAERGRASPVWMELFNAREAGWLDVQLSIEILGGEASSAPSEKRHERFFRNSRGGKKSPAPDAGPETEGAGDAGSPPPEPAPAADAV